jgi:hypothetical protein
MRDMKALGLDGSGQRRPPRQLHPHRRREGREHAAPLPRRAARHKILDILGDLYLLGRPLRGKVVARKTGHSDNIALLRKIHETYGR